MGALTYTLFKSRLRSRFGENDEWDSYYGIWVNSAYRYLATLEKISETKRNVFIPDLETSTALNTSDGVAYIAEPTDALIVREVYDSTNNKRLDWISWQDYVGKTDKATAANENKPSYWNRRSGNIYLYPTPDAVYSMTVYYKKVVADLVAADSVTVLGSEWDDIILELANYYGRMWSNEYDRAETCMKAAKSKMVELVDAYTSEEKARRDRITPDAQMVWRPTY
jgi:hypothetical protein